MADPVMKSRGTFFVGLVGSTAITPGAPCFFDGTDWELADADDETKFAEALATADYASGENGTFVFEGILYDSDAPYTQGDQYYLSATAGAITATRPTGAGNLKQVLGFGISTSELHLCIQPVREYPVSLTPVTDGTAVFSQNNDFTGVLLGAANEAAGYTCMVPENCVGLEIAYLWWSGVGTVLDASDTYTIDVSAGVDDETNSATSDGITAAALTVAASDLNRADVSAAFDGTGIIQAGNVLAIDVDKAAEGTAGDDPLVLTCHLVFLVV